VDGGVLPLGVVVVVFASTFVCLACSACTDQRADYKMLLIAVCDGEWDKGELGHTSGLCCA
jgi:hypothetical protein